MNIRTLSIAALLVYGLAYGQTPAPAAVHPSNGVIELSAQPLLPPDTRPVGMRTEAYPAFLIAF
jgi:hypothetical protein